MNEENSNTQTFSTAAKVIVVFAAIANVVLIFIGVFLFGGFFGLLGVGAGVIGRHVFDRTK